MTRPYTSPEFHGDALKTGEREILDLWDDGQSIERIARSTDRSSNQVRAVVSLYASTGSDHRWRRKAIAGSTALAAAIAATGRRFA